MTFSWTAPDDDQPLPTGYTMTIYNGNTASYINADDVCDPATIVDTLECTVSIADLMASPFSNRKGEDIGCKLTPTNMYGDGEESDDVASYI